MKKGKKKRFPRWIPVSERYPDDGGEYLAIVDEPSRGRTRMAMEWHPGHGGLAGRWSVPWPVSHWMPLPPSPGG